MVILFVFAYFPMNLLPLLGKDEFESDDERVNDWKNNQFSVKGSMLLILSLSLIVF